MPLLVWHVKEDLHHLYEELIQAFCKLARWFHDLKVVGVVNDLPYLPKLNLERLVGLRDLV